MSGFQHCFLFFKIVFWLFWVLCNFRVNFRINSATLAKKDSFGMVEGITLTQKWDFESI